jgi:hypothetical protein
MITFFLADQVSWVWPEFTSSTVNWLIGILILGISIWVFTNLVYRRAIRENFLKQSFLDFGRKKHLHPDELKLIEAFFSNLIWKKYSAEEVIWDKSLFHTLLTDFFLAHKLPSEETHVKILDKLFPNMKETKEILSLNDIVEGEPCAIEYENSHILGKAIRVKNNSLFVSTKDNLTEIIASGKECKIYFYRYILGGYLVYATAYSVHPTGIQFDYTGKIESKGDEHIMAFIEVPVTISEWPVGIMDHKIVTTSNRVSDRAISVDVELFNDMDELLNSEIVSIKVDFDIDFTLETKARIRKSRTENRLTLKLVGLEEEDKGKLQALIKKKGAVREVIE